jgi:hypothetical protein
MMEEARTERLADASPLVKECPFCGGELLTKALKCRHCRAWMPETMAAAASSPGGAEQAIDEESAAPGMRESAAEDSKGQPLRHLILLSMATFGLYLFYWSWRSWRDIRDETGAEVSPALRTAALLLPFVSIYVLYSLLRSIRELAQARGVTSGYSPGLLTAAFHLIVFATNVSLLWFLAFAVVIPLLPAQQTLNKYWEAVQPELRIREHFTPAEIALAAAGTLMVAQLLVTLSRLQGG